MALFIQQKRKLDFFILSRASFTQEIIYIKCYISLSLHNLIIVLKEAFYAVLKDRIWNILLGFGYRN